MISSCFCWTESVDENNIFHCSCLLLSVCHCLRVFGETWLIFGLLSVFFGEKMKQWNRVKRRKKPWSSVMVIFKISNKIFMFIIPSVSTNKFDIAKIYLNWWLSRIMVMYWWLSSDWLKDWSCDVLTAEVWLQLLWCSCQRFPTSGCETERYEKVAIKNVRKFPSFESVFVVL